MSPASDAVVTSVSCHDVYSFSKPVRDSIVLLAGLGVAGDVHAGTTVKHRGRLAVDPNRPNLRQVHLIAAELHDELRAQGFDVSAGQLGENVTTRGIDLLALPRGTMLRFGVARPAAGGADTGHGGGPESTGAGDGRAAIEVTGLRNPCKQINTFRPGLLKRVLGRDERGNVTCRAGIMAVVRHGGPIRVGDRLSVVLPASPHLPLEPV